MRALLIASFLVACAGAWATDENFYGWHPSSVDIGGQHVLTFRVGSGKMTPADRRAMVEFRLAKALTHTEYRKGVNMTYQKVPAGIAIYANSIYILSVTPDDAKANNSTPRSLAQQWGNSIKRTFQIVGPARQLPHEGTTKPVPLEHLE